MTDKVLNSDDLQSLLQQFEQVDEQMGQELLQRHEQFAERLSESTPVD